MPQLQAAKKALRANQRRRGINDRWRKKVREAVHAARGTAGDAEAVQKAQRALDRAARHNIIHKNKAARLKSRLSKKAPAKP